MAPRHESHPYILFTVLTDDAHHGLATWRSYRTRLLGSPVEVDTRPGRSPRSSHAVRPRQQRTFTLPELDSAIVWRLFTANHRELGGSAHYFADFDAARDDAVASAEAREELSPIRVVNDVHDRFAWVLAIDGTPVLISNHWYGSWRDRDNSLQSVRAALGTAEIAENLDDVVRGHRDAAHRFPLLENELAAQTDLSLSRPIVEAPPERPIKDLLSRRGNARDLDMP